MGMELENKVVLLTGASGGLGRQMAHALARRGAKLVLVARSKEALESLAAQLHREGANVAVVPGDLASLSSFPDLLAKAEAAFGPIDVLINNAGVDAVVPFHEMVPRQVADLVTINQLAPMELTRLVLPGMLARRRGHIVNIASLAGKSGPPYAEAYAASKAALRGFTQSLRASYFGTGVHASVVSPGFVGGEGMYAERAQQGVLVQTPRLLGETSPPRVAEAVLRALDEDAPEIVVSPGPMRLVAALSELFPRLQGWLLRLMRLRETYAKMAEADRVRLGA